MALDRQSAAMALRALADKLSNDNYQWTDEDLVAAGTAARMLNEHQMGMAAAAGKKQMPRSVFEALSPSQKLEYTRSGGVLVD